MTLNLEAGAFAAAGAFFVLRSLPLLKGVLGLLGTNGTGRESVTDVYLKQIAENTLQMRDGIVRLSANFDQHDRETREALRDLNHRKNE